MYYNKHQPHQPHQHYRLKEAKQCAKTHLVARVLVHHLIERASLAIETGQNVGRHMVGWMEVGLLHHSVSILAKGALRSHPLGQQQAQSWEEVDKSSRSHVESHTTPGTAPSIDGVTARLFWSSQSG